MSGVISLVLAGVLVVSALFAACKLFGDTQETGSGNSNSDKPEGVISVGSISYIITDNADKMLDIMRAAQEWSDGLGAHYGDYGTVVEWDVDFEYLFNTDTGVSLTDEQKSSYLNMDINDPYAWYFVELWGGEGGNVDTLNGGNDPATISADDISRVWGADHFAAGEEPVQRDYAFGGKGGYVAAYIKVYRGNVLYFVLGGKGKDGDVITDNTGRSVIYGFNGGGMGSGGHVNSYLNGGGGGGATSLAFNMARFHQVSDDDYRVDFTQGVAPGATAPAPGSHYASRLLVAGGGGGAGQGHNVRWISLHGGNGGGSDTDDGKRSGRMGEEEPGAITPGGWKPGYGGNPDNKGGVVSRMSAGAWNALTGLSGSYTPFKSVPESLPVTGYRTTSQSTSHTYSLVIPPAGFGKGMDAGDATESGSYNEGRGGGGGGWTGGGAVFNWGLKDKPNNPGSLNSYAYPTSSGTGGTNGAKTDAVQVPYFSSFDSIERDPETLRILTTPDGTRSVEIKLIKSATTGEDGLQGVKGVQDPVFKGNGFINVRVVPLKEGDDYTTGTPTHLGFLR
jgi:hypothetical protein